MSTVVCQNIVSCFESHMETTATIKLKVAAPAVADFLRKIVTEDHPEVKKTNLDNFGNWGFLQTSIPKETGDKTGINSYTHPLAKKSSFSRLSAKSLELCTENLGSETGTDIITDSSSIFSSSSSTTTSPPLSPTGWNSTSTYKKDNSEKETNFTKNPYQKESDSSRKIKSFPPPLTTMSGSSSLQVRRHREGGRLIIEAVEAPFRNSYLHAERSDGRLRLCFWTAEPPAAHGEEQEDDDDEEEEEEEEEAEVDECGGENHEMAAEEEEEQIDEPITDEIESEKESELDGETNVEMEMEKFQRFSRCKEGGHENRAFGSNWRKPAVWVATS